MNNTMKRLAEAGTVLAITTIAACGNKAAPAPTAPAVAAPVVAAPTPVTWQQNAQAYRSQVGQTINVLCPPNGTVGSVWGTDTYSDDSSICTAALHSGRVTLAGGGTVSIQIAPGAPAYVPTTRNGVTTSPWGAWTGSFTIVGGAAPGLVATPVGAPPAAAGGAPAAANWDTDGAAVVPTPGATAVVGCPPGGTANSVWGTDVYSSDSSVCTAAVHAGLIQLATGGVVRVTGLPGMPAYAGSARNGVTSSSWGSYSASFRVEPAVAGAAAGK